MRLQKVGFRFSFCGAFLLILKPILQLDLRAELTLASSAF
jgi:hypothetical protein